MGIRVAGTRDAAFAGRLVVAAQDIGRFVFPILVALWLAQMVLLGKPNSRPGVYDTTVMLHALFASAALTYAAWLLLSRRLPGPTRLDWAALGLIGAFVLSILTSVNPRVSLEASLLMGMAVVTFYMVHDAKGLSIEFWARALIAVAAIVSIYGLLSVATQYATWLQQVSAVKGSFGPGDYLPPDLFRVQGVLNHPSPFAMFLNLALPFVAVRAIAGKGSERRISIAVLVLAMLGVFFSLTRGAWMGTAAWCLVFGILLLARHHHVNRPWGVVRILPPRWYQAGFALSLAGLALLSVGLIVLDIRPDWLFRSTLDDRLEALRTAMAIFGDHWLTGAGPYTHLLLDDVYATRESGAIVILHAHNVYAQVLADLGIVGAAVVLIGLIVVLQMFLAAWLSAGYTGRLYVAAGIAATAGFMLHGLSDAPPSWNSVFVPFAVVLALVARLAPAAYSLRASFSSMAPRLCVLALMPLTLLAWLTFDSAHHHYDLSLAALAEGNLDVAVAEASRAQEADGALYAYALHAGVLRVQQYRAAAESGTADSVWLDEGITDLQRATALEPHSALAYVNLALALQLKGDRDSAVAAARLAVIDEPGAQDVHAAAGTVFEWAGLRDEAVKAYGTALAIDPTLAQAQFWVTTPERIAIRGEAIRQAELDACSVGYAAGLYGVYTDGLPDLASSCALVVEQEPTPENMAHLAVILHAIGKTDEARARAALASSQAPGDPQVLVSTALVLAQNYADTRYHLLKAHLANNRDAKGLLLATYVPGVGVGHGISLPFAGERDRLPDSIGILVPPRPIDAPLSPEYPAGARTKIYYTWTAQRGAPPFTLIPGDWTDMESPRTLLLFELSVLPRPE